jgi:hypothetical protein
LGESTDKEEEMKDAEGRTSVTGTGLLLPAPCATPEKWWSAGGASLTNSGLARNRCPGSVLFRGFPQNIMERQTIPSCSKSESSLCHRGGIILKIIGGQSISWDEARQAPHVIHHGIHLVKPK